MATTRRRLDAELVRRQLAADQADARRVIEEGGVTVAGSPAANPATLVGPAEPIQILAEPGRFVSRGGEKLDAAIERFSVPVAGRTALDAGASSGGFTDCLLQHGANKVIAVDVGYGQFDWKLRTDERVELHERTNVRDLASSAGDEVVVDLIVADLSFVSLRSMLPSLTGFASEDADAVLLVKPQFEAMADEVESGGVVRDPAVWTRCLRDVVDTAAGLEWGFAGLMASPLTGPAGNLEFLAWFTRRAGDRAEVDQAIAAAVDEGSQA